MLISQQIQGNDSNTSRLYRFPKDNTRGRKCGQAGNAKLAASPQVFPNQE